MMSKQKLPDAELTAALKRLAGQPPKREKQRSGLTLEYVWTSLKPVFIFVGILVIAIGWSWHRERSVREENEAIAEKAYQQYLEGEDYWDSVEPNIQPLDEGEVFWVPNGKSFHSTEDCVALLNSKTILSGSLSDAMRRGKDDPCSKCVGD